MNLFARKITERDLEHKGYPFECDNCGNKPTPGEVIKFNGSCAICGDSVIAFTIDTAEFILKFEEQNNIGPPGKDDCIDPEELGYHLVPLEEM